MRTLGAPAGASSAFGKSALESFTVRPIVPPKGASGFGNGSPFDGVPSGESLAAIAVSSRSEPQNATLQGLRIARHRLKVQLDGPGENVGVSHTTGMLGNGRGTYKWGLEGSRSALRSRRFGVRR